MTYTMVREEVKKGILKVIDLSNINPTIDFDIVYHKIREASKLIMAFVNISLETVPRLKKINPSLS
jgi:hypothetical protein